MLTLYTTDAEQFKDRYEMMLSLEKEKSVVKKQQNQDLKVKNIQITKIKQIWHFLKF